MFDEIEFSVASLQTGADAVTVKITGELDLYTAPDVRDELAALPAEARRVAVDLTELTFVDSAGIAALLVAARRLRAHGGVMMLLVDDPHVLRVLEVSGLDRYFDVRRPGLVPVD